MLFISNLKVFFKRIEIALDNSRREKCSVGFDFSALLSILIIHVVVSSGLKYFFQ